jgi:uncharacterized protein YybS (DUF2232 family)
MKQKQLFYLILGVAALLCIPLIGGLISNEVNWKLFDFVVMAFLLTLTGLAAILVYNKFKNSKLKFLFITLVGVVFLLAYVELAIGIFGTPIAGD